MSPIHLIRRSLEVAVAFGLAACASTGTTPHEMSVTGHEEAAKREQSVAAAHRGLYDPSLAEAYDRCAGGGGTSLVDVSAPCWTGVRNPTEEHRRMAEGHRRLAEKHRAAAQALRDVEARACVGVSEYDRDVSPFAHAEDIAQSAPLREHAEGGGKAAGPIIEKAVGARITFHDVPGLTVDRLQHIVECHLARNAAIGHDDPEMASCPLVPTGVSARVRQTESGHLMVEIRSDDSATAEEIWRRAERLTHPAMAPPG